MDEAISINGIEELTEKFAALTGKEQKKAKNSALKKSAQVIVKAAKSNLRQVTKKAKSPNYWNGKSLESGIKVSKIRDNTDELKVHIFGDFRLKFFQSGTVIRKNKIGANRGAMKRTNFFTNAVDANLSKAEDIIDTTFSETIQKIWESK